ncbi:MAG: hypothetical protein PHP08_01230 [Candidatus Dojkabacteria bacterium]|nr:hypothetical protein [Candidatus Dojkabacteria bacterium]
MRKFLKIFGITLLILLFLVFIFILILIIKGKSWRTSFESSIKEEYIVSSISEEKNVLNEKIEEYIMSSESVDFIEFTPLEISQYLYNTLFEMTVGTSLNILELYITPGNDVWNVCTLLNISNFEKFDFWLCMDVTKDNMQTAQLYVEDITLDGFDIGKIYPKILTQINQGIAEALTTANENGFVGRMLENIELQQDQLIIKGSQY